MRLALPEGNPTLVLVAMLAAIWPVWSWIATRALHDANDAWPLLSLVTAILLLSRDGAQGGEQQVRWTFPLLMLALYAGSYAWAPPLVRALLAMSAVAASCSAIWHGKRLYVPLWGLCLLCLPLVPSMNFYLGYPLRVVVGDATAILLQTNGLAVAREGVALSWNGQQIAIDAPCSGVRMLWAGLYLTCAIAAMRRLDSMRTVFLGAAALLVVVLANVVRSAALFYVEAGIVPQARAAHEFIGIVVFVLAAFALTSVAVRLRSGAHAT